MKTRGNVRAGIAYLLAMTMTVLTLHGCASMPQGSGAAIGGVSGATLGGAIGGATGGKTGALIGALAGGVAGALVGYAIQSRQIKDYQATKQEQGYDPSQGKVLEIVDYSISPAVVSPGQQLAVHATYYIMTPNPNQEVPITEVRVIKVYDPKTRQYREIGRTSARQVMVKPGTRQADGAIPIGVDANEGTYLIAFQVAQDDQKDERELQMTITKDQRMVEAAGSKAVQFTAPPKTSRVSRAGFGEAKPASLAVAPLASPANAQFFLASKVSGQGNLRDGPGAGYRIVATIQQGERFAIVESIINPPWHKIRLEDGREAWVHASLGVVE